MNSSNEEDSRDIEVVTQKTDPMKLIVVLLGVIAVGVLLLAYQLVLVPQKEIATRRAKEVQVEAQARQAERDRLTKEAAGIKLVERQATYVYVDLKDAYQIGGPTTKISNLKSTIINKDEFYEAMETSSLNITLDDIQSLSPIVQYHRITFDYVYTDYRREKVTGEYVSYDIVGEKDGELTDWFTILIQEAERGEPIR